MKRGDMVRTVCLDRRMGFSSFGRRILIRTNDPELSGFVPHVLPPLAVPCHASSFDRTWSLRRAGPCCCGALHQSTDLFSSRRFLYRGADLGAAREQLRVSLKGDVSEFARGRIFVHAGAVAWQGVGIVIPGVSMSGKTSLVRELLRAGATYFSDEYAVLDDLGRLHPYPQPLSVRVGTTAVQQDEHPVSLGAVIATASVPVGFVVATRYCRDRRWNPTVLSPGETALTMLEHAVAARRYPARVVSAVTRVAARAVGWRGDRGGAEATARSILARISSA